MLRARAMDFNDNWYGQLPLAEFAYDNDMYEKKNPRSNLSQ